MKTFYIVIILFLSIFLETAFVGLPFVLISILLLGVLFREGWIFPAAFFAGILQDILFFHTVGLSSIFFISMLGVIFIYQRKFEIQSIPFVVVFSFLATLAYGLFFGSEESILEAFLTATLTGVIFFLLSLVTVNNLPKTFFRNI